MKNEVLVVDADKNQREAVCRLLKNRKIGAIAKNSLPGLRKYLATGSCRVVLINIDNLPVNEIFFRDIKATDSSPFVMGLSSRTLHPELEEAFSRHIDVGLKNPLDPNELFYWLRCFFEEKTI